MLRPNRLDIKNINKKAYIIIPCVDLNILDENKYKSYGKIKNIVHQLRNVDDDINQKITVLSKTENQEPISDTIGNGTYEMGQKSHNYIFEENQKELLQLKLRLKYSKILHFNQTETEEQIEYAYHRMCNVCLNINTKKDYYRYKLTNINFIDKPDEYFKSKGVWLNWSHFIGLETDIFAQSKNEWKIFA